jgi:hypothetical protein
MIIRWGTEADGLVLQAVHRLISEENCGQHSTKSVYWWLWKGKPAGLATFWLVLGQHSVYESAFYAGSIPAPGHWLTLVWYWEEHMRSQGYGQVLTSTRADEEAQHFYRHLNYRDAGVLLLKDEPAELLLLKALTEI